VSGAHINPSVTIALAVTGRFKWSGVIPYIVAQLIGGTVGALLIVAAFGNKAIDYGGSATSLESGVSYLQGIVAEASGTFVLTFAVMATAVDSRMPADWVGLIIGLAVGSAIMVMLPLTGGSLNPARTFGPDIAMTIFGGTVKWGEFLLYWIGPLIGSIAAALLYDGLVRPRDVQAKATTAA
jgi:glycerol uptake facilitator protein